LSGTMHRRRPWNVLGGGWNGGSTAGGDGDTTCEVKDDLGGASQGGDGQVQIGFLATQPKEGNIGTTNVSISHQFVAYISHQSVA
jgi:hypothetical protein